MTKIFVFSSPNIDFSGVIFTPSHQKYLELWQYFHGCVHLLLAENYTGVNIHVIGKLDRWGTLFRIKIITNDEKKKGWSILMWRLIWLWRVRMLTITMKNRRKIFISEMLFCNVHEIHISFRYRIRHWFLYQLNETNLVEMKAIENLVFKNTSFFSPFSLINMKMVWKQGLLK